MTGIDDLKKIFDRTPHGNMKMGGMEILYCKKLKGTLPKLAEKIESECVASKLLFEDFNDLFKLMNCRDGDIVYISVLVTKTSASSEPMALLKIDKILTEK